MTFENLGLSADLLATVAREGYTEPTPVQSAAIPLILAGRDVLAAAQTGTGKTAAFVLPILEVLRQHANAGFSPARHPVRVLILTPTRELAVQISEAVKTYGRGVPLRSTVVYGGTPHRAGDQDPLERRRDPGRHARPPARPHRAAHRQPVPGRDPRPRRGRPHAGHGLHPRRPQDHRAACPAKRQTLLFSATFSDEIRAPGRRVPAPTRRRSKSRPATASPTT